VPVPEHPDSRAKRIVRIVAALAMASIGIAHFVIPDGFVRIVPAFLPAPLVLVYVSGFFEILGGIGLLIPRARYAAAIGLIALYVAVFPANINMAVNDIQPVGVHVPGWLMWARLPFQLGFIAVAWWLRRGSRSTWLDARSGG
jgi:uncharacterized membrane protein